MSELKFMKAINLKSLRDTILDCKINNSDAIYLHLNDFDDIACEYRETYKESIVYPFFFLNVFIGVSERITVPSSVIRIERNVSIPSTQIHIKEEMESFPPIDTVYRCGWCGNVVDYDGSLLDFETRNEYISILEKFQQEVKEVKVHGNCCPNGDQHSSENKLYI